MSNISTLRTGKTSPRQALLLVEEHVEEMDSVVFIWEKKDGGIFILNSDVKDKDLYYMGGALQSYALDT